jgi:hypothetical protein
VQPKEEVISALGIDSGRITGGLIRTMSSWITSESPTTRPEPRFWTEAAHFLDGMLSMS